jgi:adenylate cyclase
VLFAFVTTHLLNHALGLVSLAAMDAGLVWFLALWRSAAGTVALYAAFLVHMVLALWSLYRRRHLRMPAWEATQLVLGLLIPPLLVSHAVGTRLAAEWLDVTTSYRLVTLALWELQPVNGARQLLVLALAWVHGCIGLHFWLRLRPWYPRVVPVLYGLALVLPVCAALGFAHAGREVSALARQPGWVQETLRAANAPDPARRARLAVVERGVRGGFLGALALVLLARGVRAWHDRRRGAIRVTYAGGGDVLVPVGFTLLEASRLAGIPHVSVCGGRGRCSTCRVRVERGLDRLPAASPDERRVLHRVGAAPDVRLACQVRPAHDLVVRPLLSPGARARDRFRAPEPATGQEREIAVLFADLRGFTTIAERKLPYDVVFILNRYFESVGSAIEGAGGTVNQFTGDGVMALFGVTSDPEAACRQALRAAGEILRSLDRLGETLADELAGPLRMGIGIHAGPAVVGRMGYSTAMYLTAVGDTVHVASRLEGLTKEYGAPLVISEKVARLAGLDVSACPRHEVAVRNRSEPLAIRVVEDIGRLLPGHAG